MFKIKHCKDWEEWIDSRTASINKACEKKEVFVPLLERGNCWVKNTDYEKIPKCEKTQVVNWIKVSDVLECLRELEKEVRLFQRVGINVTKLEINYNEFNEIVERVFGSITKR